MKVPDDFPLPINGDDVDTVEITDWFAARELVDLSECGPQCPAYWQGLAATATSKPLCVSMNSDAPTGHPCPVHPARKETT